MSNGQCEEIYSDLPGSFLIEPSSADHKTSTADDADGAASTDDDRQPIAERIYEKLNILRPVDGPGSARPDDDGDRSDDTRHQETTGRQRQQGQVSALGKATTGCVSEAIKYVS